MCLVWLELLMVVEIVFFVVEIAKVVAEELIADTL